jgi:CHAT domain-containing protein/Tfp pilus assembly protein PilF
VRFPSRFFSAILGSSVIAVSLCGSTWRPLKIVRLDSPAADALNDAGQRLYSAGEFERAREAFRAAALEAEHSGSPHQSAMNWSNAGGAALARLDFRHALPDFLKARKVAESYGLRQPYLSTMNNLAGLYLQMGDPDAAMRVANESLAGTDWADNSAAIPQLRFQLATALSKLNRFDEAEPIYRRAIEGVAGRDDLESTARMLGNFGGRCLDAGRLADAESALSAALFIVRFHHLGASANILRGLARLRGLQGDRRSAAALFTAALQAPPGVTSKWEIYADRGDFRLGINDLSGAMADFRQARGIARQFRADVVPSDQDRIMLENGLSRLPAGLVDAGNRLALLTSNSALLRETFDAAEQDHLWSLRALIPAPNDWRTRLPESYWDLLARYQTLERSLVADPPSDLSKRAAVLRLALQQIEAAAANEAHAGLDDSPENGNESAIAHVRNLLDPDTVLLSFHLTKSSGWLWAVDRQGVEVHAISNSGPLEYAVTKFAIATRNGAPEADALGRDLYLTLFGKVSPRYLSHQRWLLELDGPLFNLPFSALVVGRRGNAPAYLFENKVLQTIPGALMMGPHKAFEASSFLGIGDPIYSPADDRYRGDRGKHEIVLPRLPSTANELEACSRAWNSRRTQLLTGSAAGLAGVRQALHSNPSVIHFATHVVAAPGNTSGLIALSLDAFGAMGLMGPMEIAAYTVTPNLVVLNGCHSGMGESLPGAGLTGLTRAWIGAGARAVLATQWDIPDDAGAQMMAEFYRILKTNSMRGPAFALHQAQLQLRENTTPDGKPAPRQSAVWGAYFVMGRE